MSDPTRTERRRQPSPVGVVLQMWRRNRRMSQLDLSGATGVTSRHISFIETGRASPSREMLDTLAVALGMPLRDRNDLYLAAGYRAPYRELGLDDDELADARAAIDRILASHEPLPAVVMDRHWNLLRSNQGAAELFGAMVDLQRVLAPVNVLELVFDQNALRPFIDDWDTLAPALLERARRESVGGVPDPTLAARLDRLRRLLPPDRPMAGTGSRGSLGSPGSPGSFGPLIPIGFTIDGETHRFFSTVTTLGTPRDITLQELRVELFHPVQ